MNSCRCEHLSEHEYYPPAAGNIIVFKDGEARLEAGTYSVDMFKKDEVRAFCTKSPDNIAQIVSSQIHYKCLKGICAL